MSDNIPFEMQEETIISMSDNISFEIQENIIKRISPVKSLLRFRSVSKQWKSLIDSSAFIAHHHCLVKPDNLLVRYSDNVDSEYKYVSIVDDDSFPQHKFSHVCTQFNRNQMVYKECTILFDSSQGLVCLYGKLTDLKTLIVLWNPSIRKSVGIELPRGSSTFGFGVCPKTLDPKILKTTPLNEFNLRVELFTLSSGAFRTISTDKSLLLRSIASHPDQKVIDGVIYWITFNEEVQNVIVSFDLTTEEFGEVALPDILAAHVDVFISKIKGSLAVLDFFEDEKVCDVWMMKNGFAKLFSVSLVADDFKPFQIFGFRKNGEVIRKHQCESDSSLVTLDAYEPSTKHRTDLGTHVASDIDYPFEITSYTESLLLLLNCSNSIIQG